MDNVGKATINHTPNHHKQVLQYKPFPNGWFIVILPTLANMQHMCHGPVTWLDHRKGMLSIDREQFNKDSHHGQWVTIPHIQCLFWPWHTYIHTSIYIYVYNTYIFDIRVNHKMATKHGISYLYVFLKLKTAWPIFPKSHTWNCKKNAQVNKCQSLCWKIIFQI